MDRCQDFIGIPFWNHPREGDKLSSPLSSSRLQFRDGWAYLPIRAYAPEVCAVAQAIPFETVVGSGSQEGCPVRVPNLGP